MKNKRRKKQLLDQSAKSKESRETKRRDHEREYKTLRSMDSDIIKKRV